jgi:hypothetical protein
MRTVASKIDNTLHNALTRKCGDIGCSPSEYIRSLIRGDLEETRTFKEPEPLVADKQRAKVRIVLDSAGKVIERQTMVPKAKNVRIIDDNHKDEKITVQGMLRA